MPSLRDAFMASSGALVKLDIGMPFMCSEMFPHNIRSDSGSPPTQTGIEG